MRPFKRLIHADLQQIQNNVFSTLGKEGRNVLKNINDYKYKVTQFKEIVVNDKDKKQIEKCIKDLDNVSAFIYSFVYELENYELVEDFDKKLDFTVPDDVDEDAIELVEEEPVEEDMEEPTDEEENEDSEEPDFSAFDEAAANDEDFEEPEE